VATVPTAQRRNVVNTLVIITAVILIALAMWGSSSVIFGEGDETRAPLVPWLAHFFAGALALVAVFLAQRWGRRWAAQALLVVAGVILLGALAVVRDFGPAAWLTLVLPALLLLVATPLLGPMPPVDPTRTPPPSS
jgi:peptidoglycan/LPS O-acetylase OafA/YrhL